MIRLQPPVWGTDAEPVKDSLPVAGRTIFVRPRGTNRGGAVRMLDRGAVSLGADTGARTSPRIRWSAAARGRRIRRGVAIARALPAMLGLGMLVLGIVFALRGRERTWTVSEVTQEMRRIALEGGADDSPMAGSLGPLRIAARTIDAASGEFLDFRLESERMLVSAARAVLEVDAARDTFAFELHDVTFTLVPDGAEPGGEEATGSTSYVHTTERHLFGPTAFGSDIVADGATRIGRRGPAFGGGGGGGGSAGGVLTPRGANADTTNTDWLRDAGAN